MTTVSKTLVALTISSAVFVASASDSEARFRAKYGRSTPAVEAQQSSTAYRDAKPAKSGEATTGNWADQHHQTKLGRATPATEARIEAEKSSTAYREVKKAPAEDRWQENLMERKYGRSPKK